MKPGTILCCGEALTDFIPRLTREGAPAFEPKVGGSLFNTAVALGRLDVASAFLGGLSTDFFGDELRKALAASHVDISLSPVTDRYTICAFVKLEEGHARYSFIDEGSACRMLAPADLPSLPDQIVALHLGSFVLAIEPCGSAYEELCRRECHKRVIHFDPNIRANLIKDRERHRQRVERIVSMSDIIKMSDEDLAWMAPGTSPESFAQDWLSRGAKLVVVTRGKDGALAFTRTFDCEVPGAHVKVADTIGAGDTFTAGLLTWLTRAKRLSKPAIAALDRESVIAALKFAVKAAAVTVSRPGADPPWSHELEG
ncbi:carbohydrate kinase family protein [Taklimakanibacter lacteus]|uniref:carbohydrate kinase family protein n=1 Tax=Taklimakanibacter lacteus TaxID=2268456 RepID=UPI000E65F83D